MQKRIGKNNRITMTSGQRRIYRHTALEIPESLVKCV